jgi:hypothetical protein
MPPETMLNQPAIEPIVSCIANASPAASRPPKIARWPTMLRQTTSSAIAPARTAAYRARWR